MKANNNNVAQIIKIKLEQHADRSAAIKIITLIKSLKIIIIPQAH
jgi:hypothetical protein